MQTQSVGKNGGAAASGEVFMDNKPTRLSRPGDASGVRKPDLAPFHAKGAHQRGLA